jgi:uncharacterized membrane protein
MLSSVLHSETAIMMNIAIMRAFVQFRRVLELSDAIRKKIEELELTVTSHDERLKLIFKVIEELIGHKEEPSPPRQRIGYKIGKDSKT